MTAAGTITNFHAADNSGLFKFEQEIIGVTAANGRKNFEIMVLLKYLSNFWKTIEMPSINFEINLILTWSDKCVLANDKKAKTITDTKVYVPAATLSTKDNAKLPEQLTWLLKEQLTINI